MTKKQRPLIERPTKGMQNDIAAIINDIRRVQDDIALRKIAGSPFDRNGLADHAEQLLDSAANELGEWLLRVGVVGGFEKAAALAECFPVRRGNKVVPVSVPEKE